MDTEQITLNDQGVALLGNAILLGGQLMNADKYTQRSDRGRVRTIAQRRERWSELKGALYAAGMLDDRLSAAMDISQDKFGEGHANRFQRLKAIADSDADIARVRFGDFDFPAAVSKRYRIGDALADAKPGELQAAISRSGPSELMDAVRALVVDYMKDLAAFELGMTRAAAAFVGLDGLVMKRSLREPPKWHSWNSERARQVRRESGWLEEMREKARRHVLEPATRSYADTQSEFDVTKLGLHLEQFGHAIKDEDFPVLDSLSDLGSLFYSEPLASNQTVNELFPSYGAMLDHKNYRADADPLNALIFFSTQMAWQAVKEGWALCLAEDGLEGGYFTWAPPDRFPSLTENGDLGLPEELGITGCFDLDERAKLALGAERLWFVFAKDVVAATELPELSKAGDPPVQEQARKYNQGFTLLDAPFIEEGLKMLESGEAKSALNAAKLLVEKYGEIAESQWRPGRTEIRSFTLGSAEGRLQRAIAKERKKRNL
ncbi:hypothetical protein [Roseovarius indicus]|uniref:hypothetical protein n=1 Tax=Roseovarius indicus TaxID=540747 RepID=UPI004058E3D1